MTRPLEGIRVADFSHVMAGPFASHLLRLMGAEVIKIEAPGRGDAMRYYGNDRRYDGMAPAFIAVNAGKKSIALDLKDPRQHEVARRIIERSDVLLENFRPGVMARLGLGAEAVHRWKPDLIYCSVSGYGQTGPLRDWPAIDNIVQATSGMMSLGGDPGDPPMRVGFPVVDTLTGQTAAFAIATALVRRGRTGAGDTIDVAMFDATLSFMTSAVVPWLVTGKALARMGNTGYSGQPTSALFEARDGRLVSLGVVQQHQFEDLARFVGRADWLSDPRFADPESRCQHAAAMREEVQREMHRRDAAQWEVEMSLAGIPCGMVREVGEAASLPHLGERGLRLPLRIPGLPQRESVEIVNAGFQMESEAPGVAEAPPRLGEHSVEIMQWLGYTSEEAVAVLAAASREP
jgi:crotonobetainyl-CoA:carnitine CoA-transferase CaiB-like acyl-CoA transferase